MPSSTYRADIDGLRAVAVAAVLLYHAFPGHARGGFMGVDVFFVISGYLITGILTRPGGPGIAEFYRRRVRRIFPALIVMLIGVLTIGWALFLADDYVELARQAAAGAGFVSNVYYWSQVSYFDISAAEKTLLHLWSIGVEEQFYLLWPLLIWACRRARLELRLVIGAVAALSLAYALHLSWNDQPAAFYSPFARLWELGTGGLLAVHRPNLRKNDFVSVAGAALVIGALALFRAGQTFPGFWVLLPVSGTALVIWAGPSSAINRMLSHRLLVWVGLISYPLYLWHWPLLSFAAVENSLGTPSPAMRFLLLGAAAVLSVATYYLIERPLRKGPAAPLFVAMLLVLAASLAIARSDGLQDRPVNRDQRKAFVAYYTRMQRHGLASYYRPECDFVRWGTYAAKQSIEPSCVRRGAKGTHFLWGDSHAEALSYGIRRALPDGYALAQVATSGCSPWMPDDRGGPREEPACIRSNEFALEQIRLLRPEIVFLAQKEGHEQRSWDRLGTVLLRLGVQKVILVGPLPQWNPSLPRIILHDWPPREDYVATGLQSGTFRTDAIMRRRPMRTVRYISVAKHFCRRAGCLAIADGHLMAVDYGHLSPQGSLVIGRFIVQQLQPPSTRTANRRTGSSRST